MRPPFRIETTVGLLLAASCVTTPTPDETTIVPAGKTTSGSTPDQRAHAIEAAVRRGEDPRSRFAEIRDDLPARTHALARFVIMHHPVSQDDYARYVYETGAPEPWVDAATWARTPHEPHETVDAVAWQRGRPRAELVDAPAVLVAQPEASAYCAWWGEQHHGRGQLPSEAQWERAMQEHAIVVSEWTDTMEGDRAIVKGGAPHTVRARPAHRRRVHVATRHVAIGFRCVFAPG
jgi:formylglycine-generating enzyme required for sulfatase activity